MKSKLYYLLIGICSFAFISCERTIQNENEKVVIDPARRKCQTKDEIQCDSMVPNIITADQAAQYIANFWNTGLCKDCVAFGEEFGSGSFLRLDSGNVNLFDNFKGATILPCASTTLLGLKKQLYFVAKRDSVCPGMSEPGSLIKPGDTLYTSALYFPEIPKSYRTNAASVKSWLGQKIDSRFINKDPVTKDNLTAVTDNYNYKNFFKKNPKAVNYGFGFIQDYCLDSLYFQPALRSSRPNLQVMGFCAFLGFDNTKPKEQVRIVLIPVDENGYIMLSDGVVCLEKSWPPIDPEQLTKECECFERN